MKRIFFFFIFCFSLTAFAQTTFHPVVKVEFEKVIYVRQQYKELFPEWYDEFKNMIPDKVVNYYEFTGDTTQSLFRESKEAVLPANVWYQEVANKNVVFNNYSTNRTITQKPVAEETFLVEDSLLNIRWKLTADTRTIAGYDCRKAIGFINDTLAVFAFYTDELLVRGGPESVQGLPGNDIRRWHTPAPHYLVCYKVEVNGVQTSRLPAPAKGKKVTRKTLNASLQDVMKNWGKYGQNMMLNFVI